MNPLDLLRPFARYIELGVILVVVAGFSWIAWTVRGSIATREQNKAVAQAIDELQMQLEREQELRSKYEKLADDKLEALLKSISKIKIEHTVITNNITQERQANPQFYSQPLPPGGYEQWKRARALVDAASSPSSSPVP